MINHNTALSMTMNVSELAPKAATATPTRGQGAFGEALTGARGVLDRRGSQEAAAPSRRDWAQGDRSGAKPIGQDRAESVRSDFASRASNTDPTGTTGTASSTESVAAAPVESDAATGPVAPVATHESATTAIDPDASSGEAPVTTPTAATTVAVAAAPVLDLDAIIVPTTTQAEATTDAVDAAIRMAITVTDAAPADVEEPTTTMQAAVTGPVARDAEDAGDDDVQAGPTRLSTSTSTTTSGPSPTQLAAATFTDAEATTDAPDVQVLARVATTQVAEGDAADADAQLVQAAAVAGDDDGVPTDDAHAPAVVLKAKADVTTATAATTTTTATTAATASAATTDVLDAADPVEADVPEAVQAARLNQQQSPTVATAAQHQAAAQARAAERATAEEGGEAAAPKLEPLPTQAAPVATVARTEGGIRVREGLLTAHQQVRIDHIAEQLATRLRLSQAAGGSQVHLSLKPRELGDVTVQMQVRDGIVAATVLVDRAETARTMQGNLEDLRRSLEQQGLSIQEFSVDVRGETGAGGADARAAADLRGRAGNTSTGSTATLAGAAAVIPGLSGDDVVAAEDVHDGDLSVLA